MMFKSSGWHTGAGGGGGPCYSGYKVVKVGVVVGRVVGGGQIVTNPAVHWPNSSSIHHQLNPSAVTNCLLLKRRRY